MSAFSALSARERATALLDPDSARALPQAEETPFWLGEGELAGRPALLILTDGHQHGGTFGVREAQLISQLLARTAARDGSQRPLLFFGFDTGGVRVEEGPAALAATSAAGVALAQALLDGVRSMAIISGPRGCFGAPAVMAALPQRAVMTAGSHWGLTGPKLIDSVRELEDRSSWNAVAAANRLANGDTAEVVADSAEEVRAAMCRFATAGGNPAPSSIESIRAGAETAAQLWQRLRQSGTYVSPTPRRRRRRGLLEYSLRRQWRPSEPIRRSGMLQAGLGKLAGWPALAIVVGPEAGAGDGLGIEETALATEMLAHVCSLDGPPAVILTLLFCQGHAVDSTQERFGMQRALAECLRAMVAARMRGHPLISVLGGGTYGAAYFALTAPSHRILALHGTAIAPMSPEVLAAFQDLRGRSLPPEDAHLAKRIPEVRIVESIIRLPRILREELTSLTTTSPRM